MTENSSCVFLLRSQGNRVKNHVYEKECQYIWEQLSVHNYTQFDSETRQKLDDQKIYFYQFSNFYFKTGEYRSSIESDEMRIVILNRYYFVKICFMLKIRSESSKMNFTTDRLNIK